MFSLSPEIRFHTTDKAAYLVSEVVLEAQSSCPPMSAVAALPSSSVGLQGATLRGRQWGTPRGSKAEGRQDPCSDTL